MSTNVKKYITDYMKEHKISPEDTASKVGIALSKLMPDNEESLSASEFLSLCSFLGLRPEDIKDEAQTSGVTVVPFRLGDVLYDCIDWLDQRPEPEVDEIEIKEFTVRKNPEGKTVYIIDHNEYHLEDFGNNVFFDMAGAEEFIRNWNKND